MCSHSLCVAMFHRFRAGKRTPITGIIGQCIAYEHTCNLWVFPPPEEPAAVLRLFAGETVRGLSPSQIKQFPDVLGPYQIDVAFLPRRRCRQGQPPPREIMPWPLLGQKGFLDNFVYAQDGEKRLFAITPL